MDCTPTTEVAPPRPIQRGAKSHPKQQQRPNNSFDLKVLRHDDETLVVGGVTPDTPVQEVKERVAAKLGTQPELVALTHTMGRLEGGGTLRDHGFVNGQRGVALSNSL